ncbi:hypothetical protein [Actinospica robiniae]|uniref:hypothetical protein n=1 Tax=Actinospica robiniae TaxID=304901 RepID=UPI000552AF48|nr:hypothetical protein [Actinospica robiniae]
MADSTSLPVRHRDPGLRLIGYAERVLVRCPACGQRALSTRHRDGYRYADPARLTCARCGYARETRKLAHVYGVPLDPFFKQPLWLQTACCGHTLWALNVEHLDALEGYVSAQLREKRLDLAYTMLDVLPGWMKAAKHRDEVLRAVSRLRQSLET